MKIVLAIFKYFPFGGLQKDFLRIAAALAGRDHEVVCCTGSWSGAIPPFLRVETFSLRGWSNHARALDFEHRFRAFLQAERPDRSVTFNRLGGADFYFAADNCLALQFEERHTTLLRLFPRYRIFLRQERDVFTPDSNTRILTIVERQKTDYQREYNTPDERFILLPPGIDPSCVRPPDADARRAAKRAELGLSDDRILLVQVASVFSCKGCDRTLAALAALPPSIRSRCMLTFVGGNPRMITSYRKKAQTAGVGGQTLFAGPRNDVGDFLLAADLMVHPARNEAAGAVLAEALAAGLPVICSGECGFEYLVREAGGIVLPVPFVQTDLNAGLQRLLDEPGALSSLRSRTLDDTVSRDFTRRADVAAEAILG